MNNNGSITFVFSIADIDEEHRAKIPLKLSGSKVTGLHYAGNDIAWSYVIASGTLNSWLELEKTLNIFLDSNALWMKSLNAGRSKRIVIFAKDPNSFGVGHISLSPSTLQKIGSCGLALGMSLVVGE